MKTLSVFALAFIILSVSLINPCEKYLRYRNGRYSLWLDNAHKHACNIIYYETSKFITLELVDRYSNTVRVLEIIRK